MFAARSSMLNAEPSIMLSACAVAFSIASTAVASVADSQNAMKTAY
jgi:hypothetical protein